MKKITLVLGLLLGGIATSQAQTGVQFGLKTGVSMAVLDGTINQETKFKPGLHLGAVMRWRPSTHVAIQPELVYSRQGSDNKQLVGYGTMLENKTKLSYLNLPVLLKVYLGEVVNLQVGPQFGLLLGARQDGQVGYYSGSSGSGYVSENRDVKADYKGDVGICGGLGLDLKNGLLIAARLNYGLTDINNNEQDKQLREYLDIGGLHNRVLEFSVGYMFGGK
ncbi:PorT family protein [Hymenobacter sp. BT186]|uniref:PorT family protein n=1 Tax=Hymenobacter telluris TaxID=2816474 RepID=A0A939EXB3_9BACT|nr:porin family protein [Hymenobacter telluris]MBO0358340.1 PorT family protein [Hymenobacter telluris]MBW3374366.1 PorT family protein [Hymenobacter norwichensis]